MRIKFLQTSPSANEDVPFRAGQVIDLLSPTPEIRQAITEGRAIVLREEPQMETAMVESDAQASDAQAPKRATRSRAIRV